MAASPGALAAGLLLLSLSHVLPSLQDSFPHSLSYPGPRLLVEVLGRPTLFTISVLKDPPGTGQVMLIVVGLGIVRIIQSIGHTMSCCREVLVCSGGRIVCDLSIRPTSSA